MIDLLTSIPRVPENPYFETIRTYGELGVLVKNKVNFENTKKLFIFTLTAADSLSIMKSHETR